MPATSRSFTIADCLGRGGFGEVYRAQMVRDAGIETEVALKVLRRDIDPDGQAVQRLRDEGRLLSRLNHPAILKVHDLIVLEGRIALITEYVDGDDLSDCLRGEEPIQTKALLEVVAVLADALDAAWNAPTHDGDGKLRMVHRDIKPSNVRISRHGQVKLLDFGIARTDSAEVDRESRTRTGMIVGSPAYMAPERFMERTVYLESDVFSLCAMLYEGATGDRFYEDLPIPMQVGLAVDGTRFEKHLLRCLDRIPAGPVRDVMREGLAYASADRPSPGELARRLDELAHGLEGPSLARFVRQRRWSEGLGIDGELQGRTLTETHRGPPIPSQIHSIETLEKPMSHAPSMDRTPERASPPAPAPRRWRWPLGVAVLVLSGGLAAGALLLTGGLAAALPYAFSKPEIVELVPRVPTSADPKPAPSKPVAPDLEPSPRSKMIPPRMEPVVPQGVEGPRSRPPPAAPPPPAPVVATGDVALTGGVVAVLVGGGKRHRLPASIPVGTYQLQALFNGLDAVSIQKVTVTAGMHVRIDCSAAFTRCTVK